MLMGVIILAQVPKPLEVGGVALVVVAGMGATRGGHRQRVALDAAIPLLD